MSVSFCLPQYIYFQTFDVGESFSQLLVEGDSDDDSDVEDNTLMAIVKNPTGLKTSDPKQSVFYRIMFNSYKV